MKKIYVLTALAFAMIFYSFFSRADDDRYVIAKVRDDMGVEIRKIFSSYSECEKRGSCELYTNSKFGDLSIEVYGTSNIDFISDVAKVMTRIYLVTGKSEIDISIFFYEKQKSYYLDKSMFFQQSPFITLEVNK